MTSPLKYELSPLVGAFTRNRTTLAFFKGKPWVLPGWVDRASVRLGTCTC